MDEYPCTYDVRGNGGDMLLGTLERAMHRYQTNGSDKWFLGEAAEVCAVGAVLAADGVIEVMHGIRERAAAIIEHELSTVAREAIRRLDTVAAELYPAIAHPNDDEFLGPLERLNQETAFGGWSRRFAAVLRVYREVISRRKAELTAESDALHAELAEAQERELVCGMV